MSHGITSWIAMCDGEVVAESPKGIQYRLFRTACKKMGADVNALSYSYREEVARLYPDALARWDQIKGVAI
jgi:hypothetical protein